MNAVARDAVSKRDTEATVARVRHVFDAVAKSVDGSAGEASFIVHEWRERSGNLGTLFDYFLSRNYLLNYYFFDRGSDLLIPLERDRYGLTLAEGSLDALFMPKAEYVAPWIVNTPDFVFGTSYGATPIVNRAKARGLHQWIREHLQKSTRSSGRADFGTVMQVIAANEVAHATLVQRYGYTVESSLDMSVLKLELPGLVVENARQVHEFISDAASLGTDRVAVFAITANLMQLLVSTETGTNGIVQDNAYSPSASFFIKSVHEILNRRGRELDIEGMITAQSSKTSALRRYASGQLTVQILEALGDDGYRDLVNDYRSYARILIRHIAKSEVN